MITDPNGAADAVILVDDAGTVTLFIGASAEPHAEATTNSAVIRILLEYAAHLNRAITVATHYPSGHRSLHRFEPDGTVTTVEIAMARQTVAPGTVAPAAFPPGTDVPPDGQDAAESRRRFRPGALVGAVALLVAVMSVASADRPPDPIAGSGWDDQTVGSDVLGRHPEFFRPFTDPAAPDRDRRESTPTPEEKPTGTPGPTTSPTGSPAASPPGNPSGEPGDRDTHPPEPDPPPEPPTPPGGLSVTDRSGTSLTVSWSPSSAELGVTGYAVYVDGDRVDTASTTQATVAGLDSGVSYVVSVAAIDADGTSSSRASVTASTVDVESPSSPSSLVVADRAGTSLTVSWSPATDNVGVTGYAVYVDGSRARTVDGTSAKVNGLEPATSYEISVASLDAAGNTSGRTASRGRTLDTIPPSTPTDLSGLTSIVRADLDWSAADDNVAVTGYAVYVDGTRVATTTSTSATINDLDGGTSYTFSVAAIDGAGNLSPRTTVEMRTKAGA